MTDSTLAVDGTRVEACGSCLFFKPWGNFGDCQRFPRGIGAPNNNWPTVSPNNWCGEWKANPHHFVAMGMGLSAKIAREAMLPAGYQYGDDALETFLFGKEQAALAIEQFLK